MMEWTACRDIARSKAIPVIGRGSLYVEDPTDGGKVVRPTHRPRSTPQEH
jgi:hypothetical protein